MDRILFLNNLASKKVRFNLGAGSPPIHLYPKLSLNELISVFSKETGNELLHYHQTEGIISDLAIETIKVNENTLIKKDNVIITNGVQEAIFLALTVFKEKKIACIDPYYPGFVDAARILNIDVFLIEERNLLSDLQKLEKGDLLYISSDFSNPSGKRLSIAERNEIAKIAEDKGFFIFDDATYREFFLDEKYPSLFSINPNNVIHALSFSKLLAPGLRTAFVLLPKNLQKNFLQAKANVSLNNSGITQAITGGWLLQNNFQLSSHLNLLKTRLSENRDVLVKNNILYEGGFFTSFNSDKGNFSFDSSNLLLEKFDIATCPMSLFSDKPLGYLRLCVANIESKELIEILEILFNFDFNK